MRTAGLIAFVAWLAATPVAADDAPTFATHVAPILHRYCTTCHQPDGVAPFPLIDYAEARPHARQIAQLTAARLMPPWNAETARGGFVGQPRLTDAEIQTIQQWVNAGAPPGDLSRQPAAPPSTEGWRLGVPDLVVKLPRAYRLTAEGSDVFRIFVLPIPGSATRFVRGIELRPGKAGVVHHVNLRIDTTHNSRDRDDLDPEPGYDGLLARTARFPDGHFLGWTPGQVAPLLPQGQAWRLAPGSDLVLQVHMRPSGRAEEVNPEVGFYFGADPPDDKLTVVRLGRQDIDIRPGDPSYAVTDSYVLPVDTTIEAVQPHAHYRARAVRADLTLPDGTTTPLLVITRWDFRWQHVYRFTVPLQAPAGSRLSMHFTYDNSADNLVNPVQPPIEALWGQRSAEEMGDLWVQLHTRTIADRVALDRDFRPKAVREDLIGYEALIRRSPSDVGLRDDAAVLYLEIGQAARAAAHWKETTRLTPDAPAAHFNLATALALDGRLDEAIAELTAALRLNPGYNKARNNLGRLLLARGQFADAASHFAAALRNQPADAEAHYNMAMVHRATRERDRAISELRTAAALAPDWLPASLDLSWMLATARSVTRTEAEEAVRSAERAVALTNRQDAAALDTLGVALAAAGLFDRARSIADEALALARDSAFADDIRDRRTMYLQHRPYAP